MKRVTGIGGVFFKSKDPAALGQWYKKHLGINVQDWGGAVFQWHQTENPGTSGSTTWSPFPAETKYFDPSPAPFMFSYRVHDLTALLAALVSEGVKVVEKIEESEYGKFGWAFDPEGNKFELWQPPEGC